jgi:hypothetical protein
MSDYDHNSDNSSRSHSSEDSSTSTNQSCSTDSTDTIFYDDDDDSATLIDGWLHDYNNFDVLLSTEDPVDNLLTLVLEEEIRHIFNVVSRETNHGTLNEIASLVIKPLIPVIVQATNSSVKGCSSKGKVSNKDAAHFIRCLIALSIYRVSPNKFFSKKHLFPLAKDLNENLFKKVYNRLNSPRKSDNQDSTIYWDKPFTEDPSIRDGEESITRINRQFFLTDISILSTDDDHLRLSSSECEDIGLPRKNNPKKAFGPVSTGIVSLTSGITLATRIAGRGEKDLATMQILCQSLFNKQLADQVETNNLFAMDRGYLSASMIKYIDSIGGSIIGTHKRVQTYPFTFGYQKKVDKKRVTVEERGAKMIYWATKTDNNTEKSHNALAYRSGKDHVATIFTTYSELNPGGFIYKLKKNSSIPQVEHKICKWMDENVIELTFGQGGSEWHFLRSGLGIITSSVASMIFNMSNLDNEFETNYNIVAAALGSTLFRPLPSSETLNHQYTHPELVIMNVNQLKDLCRAFGQRSTGNKNELIERVLSVPISNRIQNHDYVIKNKLIGTWFMAPVHNTPMKIGKRCEPLIAEKIPQFIESAGHNISNIVEVGLVKSSRSRYLATSIDRLCVFSLYNPNIHPEENRESLEKVMAVEIKCMTNKKTREKALKRISTYEKKYVLCFFGDATFKHLVWNINYRTQVLHHVCTYNLSELLFVVGSQKEIIYACRIYFPENIRNAYKSLMENFGSKYIAWYQDDDDRELKKQLSILDLQHATDVSTVLFWRKMARKITEINKNPNQRLGSAHDIIPHAISLWNKCKGGQDVVSRQLKNVKVDFYKLKPRAAIIIRQVMTQLLNAHLLYRIYSYAIKINNNNKTASYTYKKIKTKLNKIQSFSDTLEDMFDCWKFDKLCEEITEQEQQQQLQIRLQEETAAKQKEVDGSIRDEIVSKIPRKNRIEFFNHEGKPLRLTLNSSMDHIPETTRKNKCLLCKCHTTVKCSTCTIQLCKYPFGKNILSCYKKFHHQVTLKSETRGGGTYKHKPSVEGSARKRDNKEIVSKPKKKDHPTRFKPKSILNTEMLPNESEFCVEIPTDIQHGPVVPTIETTVENNEEGLSVARQYAAAVVAVLEGHDNDKFAGSDSSVNSQRNYLGQNNPIELLGDDYEDQKMPAYDRNANQVDNEANNDSSNDNNGSNNSETSDSFDGHLKDMLERQQRWDNLTRNKKRKKITRGKQKEYVTPKRRSKSRRK